MSNAVDSIAYLEIPVPTHLVLDVYRFISGSSKGQDTSIPVEPGIEAEGQQEWTTELLERMYMESPKQSIQVIMRYLADHPDQWVPSSELVEAVKEVRDKEMKSGSLAGMLGAFGRRCKNRYSMDQWPMENKWSHERGEVIYRMPEWVAEVIRRVSGQN